MLKRLLALVVIGCALLVNAEEASCPFCDPTVLEEQTFYEDELIVALYSNKPLFPGHCLIIPKRHIERFEELSDKEVSQLYQTLKKVNQVVAHVFETSAYLLLQKNGTEVGQSVPHVHMHYIPRQEGDDSTVKFIMRLFIPKAPLSMEEMHENVEKLRCSFSSFFPKGDEVKDSAD